MLKRKQSIALAAMAFALSPAVAVRAAVSLEFTDGDATPTNTTVARGGASVALTLNLKSDGEQTTGLDYFLEATGAGSGNFSLASRNIVGSPYSEVYFDDLTVQAAGSALLDPRNNHDLGASLNNVNVPRGAGTHKIAVLTLSANASTPNGAYSIQTVSNANSGWIGAGPDFRDNPFNQHAAFTINVVDPQWNRNGGGSWNTAANWNAPVPNGAAAEANFYGIVTAPNAPATVTLDGAKQVARLSFNNANAYVLAAGTGGTLTIGNGTSGVIDIATGSHTVQIPLAASGDLAASAAAGATLNATAPLTVPAGRDLTTSGAGTLRFAGGVAATGTDVVHQGAGRLEVANLRAAALQVNGGTVALISNGGAGRVTSVTIAPTAKLDLTNNTLIVAGGAAGTWNGSAYTGVAGLVDTGRGNTANAQWDGAGGVVTTDTRAIATGDLVGIGVARVDDVRAIASTATTTFAGQTVLGADVLAMVTWGGDANLDGKIDIDDYGRIDSNASNSGAVFGWSAGDFNYDGKINIDDYGIIDANVGRQTGSFPGALVATPRVAGPLDGVTAVPEPALASAMALPLLFVRRRRSARA